MSTDIAEGGDGAAERGRVNSDEEEGSLFGAVDRETRLTNVSDCVTGHCDAVC